MAGKSVKFSESGRKNGSGDIWGWLEYECNHDYNNPQITATKATPMKEYNWFMAALTQCNVFLKGPYEIEQSDPTITQIDEFTKKISIEVTIKFKERVTYTVPDVDNTVSAYDLGFEPKSIKEKIECTISLLTEVPTETEMPMPDTEMPEPDTQMPGMETIGVAPCILTFEAENNYGAQFITIQDLPANATWRLQEASGYSNESWITIEKTSNQVIVNVSSNLSDDSRKMLYYVFVTLNGQEDLAGVFCCYQKSLSESDTSMPTSDELFELVQELKGQVQELKQKIEKKGTPAGTLAFHAGATAPYGWVICQGQYLSKTQYVELYSVIGNQYGESGNTFRLPDPRGLFPRVLDNGKGVDSNRTLGSEQGDAIRNLTARFRTSIYENYERSHSGIIKSTYDFPNDRCGVNGTWDPTSHGHMLDASLQVPTANENRPKNIAFTMIIKI